MVSRRDFLKIAAVGAGTLLLGGSTPEPISSLRVPRVASTPTVTPVPTMDYSGRKLCFVLWDHQLAQYNYQPRNLKTPVPETCPLYSGALNPMTPAWEAYWRGILHLCNPTMNEADFESAWNNLTVSGRAFTDATDPASGNFALHSLTCGGATHEMVTGIPEGPYMRIYTLNSRKDPPPLPANANAIDITRHFFATSGSNVHLSDGSYAVYGFPQFENCIIPLVSLSDTDLIDISRIKTVTSIHRPYNP